MTNFDVIVPLGESCNITFLLKSSNIKQATGLFEYFVTKNLYAIFNIIDNIANNIDNIDTSIVIDSKEDDNIFLCDKQIWGNHYKYDNYLEIFKRRAIRLYNIIKHNKKLLFLRFVRGEHLYYDKKESIDNTHNYTKEDIDKFISILQKINPDTSEMKLLVIHHKPNINYIEHPFIIYKYYEDAVVNDDDMKNGNSIVSLFMNWLKEVGYNI